MYMCYDCGTIFMEPKVINADVQNGVSDLFSNNPSKTYCLVCPSCEGSIGEAKECDNCNEIVFIKNGEYTDEGFLCQHCFDEMENNEED